MQQEPTILKPIVPAINLRMEELAREDKQKTYLTTDRFIKVYKSLSNEKLRELDAAWDVARSAAVYEAWNAAHSEAWLAARDVAWYAAWYAARDADLAIRAKDKITKEQFNILMHPWTSCDLSPFAEDWEEVLNPKVEDAENTVSIYVFKDDNETEYLVTLFSNGGIHFAIRGYDERTWSAPVPLIRKEVSK